MQLFRRFALVVLLAALAACSGNTQPSTSSYSQGDSDAIMSELRVALDAWRAGDYARAESITARLIDRRDLSRREAATALAVRGASLVRLRRPAEGLVNLEAAVGIHPNYSFAQVYRAEGFYMTRRYPESVLAASEAIRINPRSGHGHFIRSLANAQMRRYPDALRDIDVALRLSPNDAFLWSTRGLLNELAGNGALAAQDYRMALRLDPSDSLALRRVGRAAESPGGRAAPPTEPPAIPRQRQRDESPIVRL